MDNIKGPPADLTFTISVTRKDTGLVEDYDMEGFILSEEEQQGEVQCQQQ